MKRRILTFTGLLLVLTLLVGVSACGGGQGTPTGPPSGKLPDLMVFGTHPVGTASYVMTSGMIKAIEQYTPMKVRTESIAEEREIVLGLREGLTSIHMYAEPLGAVLYGWGIWDVPEWGPQAWLRMVYTGGKFPDVLYVREDSPIKTLADLKGKKVPFPRSAGTNKLWEAMLAYGGLTFNDVTRVPFEGYSDQMAGVRDGTTDISYGVVTAATFIETAKSLKLRIIPLPHSDTQAWERFWKVYPFSSKMVLSKLPGQPPEQKFESFTGSSLIWTHKDRDELLIYNIVKAFDQGYDLFKDVHAVLVDYTLKNATDLTQMPKVPYHSGAIRYFKEKGLWTADHDKWQAQQMKTLDDLVSAWKARYKK